MRKINFLRYLFSLALILPLFNLSAQQIVTEYSKVSANNPLKVKRNNNTQNYSTIYHDSQKKIKITNQSLEPTTIGTDGINDVNFTINLNFDPNEFDTPFIIMVYDDNGYMDSAFPDGTSPISMSVPEGTYDLMAEFYSFSLGRSHIIILEQQNISDNSTVTFNPETAINYVSINAYDENGETLDPGVENPNSEFPSSVLFTGDIYFNAGNFGVYGSSYMWDAPFGENGPIWNFYINDISDRYAFLHTFIGTGYESGDYFTKFETQSGISDDVSITNNPDSWVYHTEKFQPSLLGSDGVSSGFATSSILNGASLGGWTVYNSTPINPNEAFRGYLNNAFDGDPFDFLITPAIVDYSVIVDPDWGEEPIFIKGSPVIANNNGGVLYGSGDFTYGNFMLPFLSNEYYFTETGYKVLPLHPKFVFENTTTPNTKQGNNVPIIISGVNVIPGEANVFRHLNKGRYGEARESDFFNTQMDVSHNGNSFFTGEYMDFLQTSLPTNGDIEIKITNPNIQVSGMESENTTTIKYNASNQDAPPTLQHLQFRDADDKVTSIFNTTSGATVRVAAGDFQYTIFDEWGSGYFAYETGNSIEMQYSVYNEDNWSEIELTENEDLFQMPAFGNYYEGSLANIQNDNNDVWYDLKITCTDSAGNMQEQIISPAFKINNTLGIQETIQSDITVYPNPFTNQLNIVLPNEVKGNYTFKVTNMSGKTIHSSVHSENNFAWDSTYLSKGVYILSIEINGKVITKKVIRK